MLGIGISLWCFVLLEIILVYYLDQAKSFKEVAKKFVTENEENDENEEDETVDED